MSNYCSRNLIISILLVSTVTVSCHSSEQEKNSTHDIEKNKTVTEPNADPLNITSFLFFKKDMKLDYVIDYLDNLNIKHSTILSVSDKSDLTESIIYDKTKYIIIYNYKIGELYLDEFKVFFIENYISEVKFFKAKSTLISPYDQPNVLSNKKRNDALFYQKYSSIFYLIKDGLFSKYGNPEISSLSNVDNLNIVIPREIPASINQYLPPDEKCITYYINWGDEKSDCTIQLEDSYCNWQYSIEKQGVEHTRNIKIECFFQHNEVVREAINRHLNSSKSFEDKQKSSIKSIADDL